MAGKEASLNEKLKFEPITETGCYIWVGPDMPNGYGRVFIQGKYHYAHRVMYELTFGPVSPGMSVLHRCDVPACVNPCHLFLGTHAENMADMVRKGRSPRQPGEANESGAKLTAKDIPEIRSDGRTHREIAVDYGVSHRTIGKIKNRQDWAHIP